MSWTHRELRDAIQTLILSAENEATELYVGTVWPYFVVHDMQDELHRAFANPRIKGQVLGWQVQVANEVSGSGNAPTEDIGMDTSDVLEIWRWDLMGIMSVDDGGNPDNQPGYSELKFYDMVQAVKKVFRQTPDHDPFASVGLDGVHTIVDENTGLIVASSRVERWLNDKVHVAECSLTTSFACQYGS